jgi:hypothetical protein
VNSRSSFERNIVLMSGIDKYWMEQIKEKSDEDCIKILLGNKIDIGVSSVVIQSREVEY